MGSLLCSAAICKGVLNSWSCAFKSAPNFNKIYKIFKFPFKVAMWIARLPKFVVASMSAWFSNNIYITYSCS